MVAADAPGLFTRAGGSLVAAARMPGVAWSFSVLGYRRHSRRFRVADLPADLTDRTYVVTGANAGLGLATARALTVRGATVWLLCRDAARGEAARAALAAAGGKVRLVVVDVGELAQVRRAAAAIDALHVDGLVHNAGALPHTRAVTTDGHEVDFAVHLAGPHLLTRLLLPRLRAARGRVVFVSSGGMYSERLAVDDLQWEARPYDGVVAYAQVKRAQVVLAELWAAREPDVSFHAMHPGWADTQGVATALPAFYRATRRFLRTPGEGADTIVWLAAAQPAPVPSGGFWFDRAPAPRHLRPGTAEAPEDRARLWDALDRAVATR
ncbi:MAG: SDR family NAD(P)-dependent oxidoreductase [Kofleriaceae bacterium]